MDIRNDYVTDTGAILAESGDEKIEMNYFAGYSSMRKTMFNLKQEFITNMANMK